MHTPPFKLEIYHAADGRRLVARVWNSVDPPRARVVFLHGITSHGGWYNQSCETLSSAGFEVHFLDRRGSGLNADERGDVDCWQTWINDVAEYLDRIRNGPPLVLCGISWGGKLAAAVARQHPGLIRGLGLLCPGLFSPHEPGFLKRLFLSTMQTDRLRQRRVSIPLRRAELFTDALRWREFIDRDPLALREVTIRFAREDRQLTRFAREAAPFLRVPMLLVLAGRDRIVDNRRTRNFFSQAASGHKTLLEYANAAHTLEFEPEPSRYFADLGNWLSQVVSA